jgi:hypothetical protein
VAAAVGGNIGIGSTVGSSNDDGVDIDCYEWMANVIYGNPFIY